MNRAEEPFGPFAGVPSAAIRPAGFKCDRCRKPVRVFRHPLPMLAPRLVFHACECGTVVCLEGEQEPYQAIWPMLLELLRRSGAGVVIFNGLRKRRPVYWDQLTMRRAPEEGRRHAS